MVPAPSNFHVRTSVFVLADLQTKSSFLFRDFCWEMLTKNTPGKVQALLFRGPGGDHRSGLLHFLPTESCPAFPLLLATSNNQREPKKREEGRNWQRGRKAKRSPPSPKIVEAGKLCRSPDSRETPRRRTPCLFTSEVFLSR